MPHREKARRTIKEIDRKARSRIGQSGNNLFKNRDLTATFPKVGGTATRRVPGVVTLGESRRKMKAERSLITGGKQRNPSATRRKRRPRSIRGRR